MGRCGLTPFWRFRLHYRTVVTPRPRFFEVKNHFIDFSRVKEWTAYTARVLFSLGTDVPSRTSANGFHDRQHSRSSDSAAACLASSISGCGATGTSSFDAASRAAQQRSATPTPRECTC